MPKVSGATKTHKTSGYGGVIPSSHTPIKLFTLRTIPFLTPVPGSFPLSRPEHRVGADGMIPSQSARKRRSGTPDLLNCLTTITPSSQHIAQANDINRQDLLLARHATGCVAVWELVSSPKNTAAALCSPHCVQPVPGDAEWTTPSPLGERDSSLGT